MNGLIKKASKYTGTRDITVLKGILFDRIPLEMRAKIYCAPAKGLELRKILF